jgi:hypothetical protein
METMRLFEALSRVKSALKISRKFPSSLSALFENIRILGEPLTRAITVLLHVVISRGGIAPDVLSRRELQAETLLLLSLPVIASPMRYYFGHVIYPGRKYPPKIP